MANTGKWDKFWEEFEKLPKIQPEVVHQKGIIASGIIFAYKANEMNKDEVIDTDYFYPSSRHYKKGGPGFFKDWIETIYNHLDNYEFIVAAVIQAACYDISRGHEKFEFFLNDISCASQEKFGYLVESWIRNQYSRYFHLVEDDYWAERGEYSNYYMLGHPLNIKTYKAAAEYIHNLMKNTFYNYQFVEVAEISDEKMREDVIKWTAKCKEYRYISRKIAKDVNLTEVFPCSSISFAGAMTVYCKKHGTEYSFDIKRDMNERDYMCPECRKELELLEAAKKEEEYQKAQKIKLEQAKLRFQSDINNFKAVGGQRFDNFYDYSLVDEDYRDFDTTKVRIIHPEYGVFEMTPAKHLRSITGYNKSGVPNVPRAKRTTYVLDGSGNKMSIGDKVKWQVTGKPTWYHGTVAEIGNCFVKVQKTTDKKIVRKERDFLFVENTNV